MINLNKKEKGLPGKMRNKIYITDSQDKVPVSKENKATIKKAVNAALKYEKADFPCEISVTVTYNEKIRELNREYRNKDCATDVLSFPIYEKKDIESRNFDTDDFAALGDIVVSAEKALEQSVLYGHSFEREIAFLCVHSVLHLLGYDHEQSKEEEEYMNSSCEKILSSLGIVREESGACAEKNGEKSEDLPQKTCFVSIVGRPNVGKSTLLNAILGEKIAIVSKKPQTTRNRITGVHTVENCQYVFLDTPGIHKPKNKLGEYMIKAVNDSVTGTDVIVFIVEPTEKPNKTELEIAEKINSMKIPSILVINKSDAYKKGKILVTIDNFSKLCDFKSIIPISALQNDGVDIVLSEISKFLKEEQWYFPKDTITDQTLRQIASETIREKLLRLLDDEIPHGIAVIIEEFTEKKNVNYIRAEIYCEKETHKKIIIGKNGATLKKVSTYAREDLEKIFEKKVFLDLWVKVKENWRDDSVNLNRLGFKKEN